jgi:phosphoribosyl-ATP pyrophosphohydrolase/phosphoribosyl-AMP cyclohydrolase
LWHKGATSGNTQIVVDVAVDCDDDAVLLRVQPNGPACHKGETGCFHNSLFKNDEVVSPTDFGRELQDLYKVIESRKQDRPEGSYTSYLFNEGLDKILKKVGEEAAETIVAAKNDDDQKFVSEVSDLIYHLFVLLVARGATLEAVGLELARRRK